MINLKILFVMVITACSSPTTKTKVTDCLDAPVKGFFIRKTKRVEVQEMTLNKNLKAQGDSYESAIDYYEEVFFIPSDSLESVSLADALSKKYYLEQRFFRPTNNTQRYVKKFCNKNVMVDMLEGSYFDDEYYTIRDDNQYLYSITYVEGESIYSKIENNRFNRMFLRLIYNRDKSQETVDCFFLYKIHTIRHGTSESDFLEWGYND